MHRSFFGGFGGYPQGGLGPQAGRIQGLQSDGRTWPIFTKSPNHPFLAVLGCGGVPQVGPQAGRFQGPGASWARARRRSGRFSGLPPKVPGWQIPGSRHLPSPLQKFGGQPALPCLLSLKCEKSLFALLSSISHKVREAKCLLGILVSRRAAGTGREDPQPDNNPFQLRFTMKRTFCAECEGKQRARQPPP